MRPTKVILHCSATPDRGDKFGAAEISQWHVDNNGWSQIGYHWVIRRTGIKERGRPDHVQGAHTKGNNEHTLGVCYVGTHRPTREQIVAILELYLEYKTKYQIGWRSWFGHNEFDPKKECPGFSMKSFRVFLSMFDSQVFNADDLTAIDSFLGALE